MTIAIALAHDAFVRLFLPSNKAIGNAHGQKLEKGENFLPPIHKSGKGFSQVIEPTVGITT